MLETNTLFRKLAIGNHKLRELSDEDVKTLTEYAPKAVIIASHMDTVSHLTVTRNDIRKMKLNNVLVPEDNEIMEF